MQPALQRFGGVHSTELHPLAVALVLLCAILILTLPKRRILAPFLVAVIVLPMEQRIVVAGLNFMILRILILFVWVRIVAGAMWRRDDAGSHALDRSIDQAVILWALAATVCFSLLWMSSDALVNRLGFLYNAFGLYFALRFLIREIDDVNAVAKTFAFIALVVAICMVIEQVTTRNVLSVFGGVPEITPVRDGVRRSQAGFAHALLAGAFGATLLPLFVGLWRARVSRAMAALGVLSSAAITVTSGSSTSLMAFAAGICGLSMWPLRKSMRIVRWLIVLTLTTLHIVMKAPVWALVGRMEVFGASSGYHRFELIDQFIHRFSEWWLFGTKDTSTWGWDMWDTANQYVDTGTTGGLLTLVFFILIICRAFRTCGLAGQLSNKLANTTIERWSWALGCTVFAHTVVFMGIIYFDQTIVSWYVLIALIACIGSLAERSMAQKQGQAIDPQGALANVHAPSLQPTFTDIVRTAPWQSHLPAQ